MASGYRQIRIHPGIGMSRLGNSDEFFIGPEAPGVVVDPGGSGGPGPNGGSYRDCSNRLKRQAQRFRIYATDDNGNVTEINSTTSGVKEIKWRVHVRNVKAANYAFQGAYLFDNTKFRNPNIEVSEGMTPNDRTNLIIDPGVHTISSSSPEPVTMVGDCFTNIPDSTLPGYLDWENYEPEMQPDGSLSPVPVTYTPAQNIELGQIWLDDKQRLIFVPAPGKAECVTTPKLKLSNPSEHYDAPNGPDLDDPLVNQFAYFNVPGWWDDTCGGEIDVTVEFEDGSNTTVLSTRNGVNSINDDGSRNDLAGAWVVSAPPKFAPQMYHVVSLLDRVYEAFPDSNPNKGKPTNFYRDVYPILSRACNYGWVSAEAAGVDPTTRNMAHGPKQAGNLLSPENLESFAKSPNLSNPRDIAARKGIFNIMRQAERTSRSGPIPKLVDSLPIDPPPASVPSPRPAGEGPVSRGNQMPKLWGTGGKPLQNQQLGHNLPNEYLSLTDWQICRMQDWAEGNFEPGDLSEIRPIPLEEYEFSDQPHAMDAAALEPTIGGGFHPGIEFPYLIVYQQFFAEAFRVSSNYQPGELAAYMSSPWQGDYWSCNVAWWPVQRPDIVFTYNDATKTRTYRDWFRGYDVDGNPLSSSDGYNQMVYAWSKLGMVLQPKKDDGSPIFANGQPAFEEFERDPALSLKPLPSIQLGKSVPAQMSPPTLPFTFFSCTSNIDFPLSGRIILAGNAFGNSETVVDDQVVIYVQTEFNKWQPVFIHDYSNGGQGVITPEAPMDITDAFTAYQGKSVQVKIDYVDLHPNSERASEFWLYFEN